jgi:hypothetical protein
MEEIVETGTSASVVEIDTRAAFAEGAEFAGLFMQVVLASVVAIALIIAFYVIQRERARRRTRG